MSTPYNKRDIQSVRSKINEIRHYNKSYYLSLCNLYYNIDTPIHITFNNNNIIITKFIMNKITDIR